MRMRNTKEEQMVVHYDGYYSFACDELKKKTRWMVNAKEEEDEEEGRGKGVGRNKKKVKKKNMKEKYGGN